jgi:hypothetical protein
VPRDDNYLSRGIAHVKFRGVCCVPLIGVPAGHQLRWSSPGYSCRFLCLLAVSEAISEEQFRCRSATSSISGSPSRRKVCVLDDSSLPINKNITTVPWFSRLSVC